MAVLERIRQLEEAIAKGQEYLATGAHADWRGFRPLFASKYRNGAEMPPHRDWVRSIFLPRREKALRKAYGQLDRVGGSERGHGSRRSI